MESKQCTADDHNGCGIIIKYRKKSEANLNPQPTHEAPCQCVCHDYGALVKDALNRIEEQIPAVDPEAPKKKGGVAVKSSKLKIGDKVYKKGMALKVAGVPGVIACHYFSKELRDNMITVTGWDIGRGQWRTFDAKKIKREAKSYEIPRDAFEKALGKVNKKG